MSQPASGPPAQPPGGGGRSSARVQRLNKTAEITEKPSTSKLKNWMVVAERREKQGHAALQSGNLERAYVRHLQVLAIVVETMPKHREFSTLERSDPELHAQYLKLKARMPEVANSLEQVKELLEKEDAEGTAGVLRKGAPLTLETLPAIAASPPGGLSPQAARATLGNVGAGISKRISSLFGDSGGGRPPSPQTGLQQPPIRKDSRYEKMTPPLPPRPRTGSGGSGSTAKSNSRTTSAEDALHNLINSTPPPPSTPPSAPPAPTVPSDARPSELAPVLDSRPVPEPPITEALQQDENSREGPQQHQHQPLRSRPDQDVGEADFLARFPPLSDVHLLLDATASGISSIVSSTAPLPAAPVQNLSPSVLPQPARRPKTPPAPSFDFGPTSIIEPQQLYRFIAGDDKHAQKPSMLILDLRTPEEFNAGSILGSIHGRGAGEITTEGDRVVTINIDPVTLRDGIKSENIGDSLLVAPEAATTHFSRRNEFDLVVYFDHSSTAVGQTRPTANLADAIYKMEFSKPLRRQPVLLAGGWAGWTEFLRAPMSRPSSAETRKLVDRTNQGGKPLGPGYSAERLAADHRKMPSGNVDNMRGPSTPIILRNLEDYFQRPREAQSMSAGAPPRYVPPPPMYNQQYPGNQHPGDVTTMRRPSPQPVPGPKPLFPAAAQALSDPARSKRLTFLDDPNFGFSNTVSTMYSTPLAPPAQGTYQIPNGPALPMPQPPGVLPTVPSRPLPTPPQDAHLRGFPARQHQQQFPAGITPPLPAPPSSASTMVKLEGTLQPTRPSMPAHPPPAVPAPYGRAYGTDRRELARQRSFSIRRVGLKNLGNTCFMNSVIQCLSGTRPLARYFLDGSYKRHINRSNKLGTGGLLTEAFAELIRQMWSDQGTYIIPAQFRETAGQFHSAFASNDQQDSQEFLAFLLDKIHEDINLAPRQRPPPRERTEREEEDFERLPDQEAAEIEWRRYLARNDSVVVKMFQGQLKNRMRCESCGRTSTTYNPFMYLSVPVVGNKKGRTVDLVDCLDEFVKTEILDGSNQWRCPRCNMPRRATKSLTISKLPDVLLVHLKRFSFHGPFRDKIDTKVNFPLHGLDMGRYMPPYAVLGGVSHKYDLYAVSNHVGGLNGGHYTAMVREEFQSSEWINYDDASKPRDVSERDVISKAAYILYYVRST